MLSSQEPSDSFEHGLKELFMHLSLNDSCVSLKFLLIKFISRNSLPQHVSGQKLYLEQEKSFELLAICS